MVQIVEGFLEGAFDAEGFTDLDKCIKDANTIVSDASEAIHDFEQKDISDISAGLGKIADMIKVIQSSMSDCGHVTADISSMADMVKSFSSPTAFAWHVGKDLLVNGVDIYHDIDNGIKDFKSQSWNNFGKDIGNASAKLLLGNIQLTDDEDMCNALPEAGCHANKACSWCVAAAVPSACHSVANGKALPPGPFTCDNISEPKPVDINVQQMV